MEEILKMNNKEDVNQLLIIGNGFDLHCGLETKFDNYFKATEPDKDVKTFFDKSNLNLQLIKKDYFKEQSFWDVYLRLLQSDSIEDWSDVEAQIKNFFTEKNIVKKLCIKFLITFISNNNQNFNEFKFEILKLLKSEYISDDFIEKLYAYVEQKTFNIQGKNNLNLINLTKKIVSYKDDLNIEKLLNSAKSYMYTFLFNELKCFEKNFKSYLSNLFITRHHYEASVKSNFGNMNKKGSRAKIEFSDLKEYNNKMDKCLELLSENKKYNLLSFNYTYPLEVKETQKKVLLKERELDMCNYFVNVHGRLNKNIIIGIDEKNINSMDNLYRFTKTYRLFELEDNFNQNYPLQKSIKQIKFYGHSLAPADYSYFQSIFDFYHIYDSDVKLIFYYSDYCNDREKCKFEITNRVIELIKTYGDTLDNKNHGKNLLHKLKLENRLKIRELED